MSLRWIHRAARRLWFGLWPGPDHYRYGLPVLAAVSLTLFVLTVTTSPARWVFPTIAAVMIGYGIVWAVLHVRLGRQAAAQIAATRVYASCTHCRAVVPAGIAHECHTAALHTADLTAGDDPARHLRHAP